MAEDEAVSIIHLLQWLFCVYTSLSAVLMGYCCTVSSGHLDV